MPVAVNTREEPALRDGEKAGYEALLCTCGQRPAAGSTTGGEKDTYFSNVKGLGWYKFFTFLLKIGGFRSTTFYGISSMLEKLTSCRT